MGLTYKKRKGKEYVYFKAGRTGTYYIGPLDSPSKVKLENIEKSLEYIRSRMRKDRKTYETLLQLLPEEIRRRYADMT